MNIINNTNMHLVQQKDAYEFNYRRAPNVYEHNKVLYEQNRKAP